MKTIRLLLLLLLFLALLLPLAQKALMPIPMKPLYGVTDTLAGPGFSRSSFFDGTYQLRMEAWITQQTGFRPWLIRLKNQVDYSLFNHTGSGGVVIGKEGCLFLESYIKNYCGIEFQGTRKIEYEVNQLKLLARDLKKKNVDFLVVVAPGKATFNQELIPARYRKKGITNYDHYLRKMKSAGLHVIDLNAWSRKIKPSASYPLYPKTGVHWSSYCVTLACDTLVRYIESLRQIDMPEIIMAGVPVSDSLRYSDNDAARLMNLICDPANGPMPYPRLTFNTEGKTRPRAVIVADSYWWGVITSGISCQVFSRPRYWFYGRDVYEEEEKICPVSSISVRHELQQQDIVILLLTEATWQIFPFGLTDAYLRDFVPDTPDDDELQMSILMDKIRNDSAWYRTVREKALRNHLPADEQIRRDARYLINEGKARTKKPGS